MELTSCQPSGAWIFGILCKPMLFKSLDFFKFPRYIISVYDMYIYFGFFLFLEISPISGKYSFLFNSELLLFSVYVCGTFSFHIRRSASCIPFCETPGVACVRTCRSCSLCSRRNESHLFSRSCVNTWKLLIAFVSLIFPQSSVNLEANSFTVHGSRTASCALCCIRSEFGTCYFGTVWVKTVYAYTLV